MTSGKVVHFDTTRGFGFLAPEGGGDDVFLHINDIDIDESQLKPGTEVEFDLEDGERGPKAVNVVVTGAASGPAPVRKPPHRGDRPERKERNDRPARRPAATDVAVLGMMDFVDEITELLLDSSDSLTAGQIIAIRQKFADFAYARGWVSE